jgi:hypothetical protein
MNLPADSNGTVFCTNCGQKLTAEDRFCPECGTPRPALRLSPESPPEFTSSLTTAATLGTFTGAPPFMPMSMAPVVADSSQPLLQYEVEYPEQLSRLLIFVKWLLAIPHLLVLWVLGIAFSIVTLIAWFAILLTGRYPRGMWDFAISVMRWQANVGAYLLLQRDEYPPFSGSEPYPVRLELGYPERLSRWKIFLKWLLVLPNVFVFYFVILIGYFAVILAWFAILITGRYPRGLFDFVTGTMRWANRINAYVNLLTDAYPPFRMGP